MSDRRGLPALVIRAAGGVLWRPGPAGIEVAIVHRPRYDDWSMPKGKLDDGEHPLHAACREVVEETGVRPAVGRRLPHAGVHARPGPQDGRLLGDDPGRRRRLRRDRRGGQPALGPAGGGRDLAQLRPGPRPAARVPPVPPATAMVLLVRHAKAGDRGSWPGDDMLRPLDPTGEAQAAALRAALRWFGPDRVFAADPVRCVQTVAALAADLGVPVLVEPGLAEQAYADDPGRGIAPDPRDRRRDRPGGGVQPGRGDPGRRGDAGRHARPDPAGPEGARPQGERVGTVLRGLPVGGRGLLPGSGGRPDRAPVPTRAVPRAPVDRTGAGGRGRCRADPR